MLKTLLSTLVLSTALTSAAWAGPGTPTATRPGDPERAETAVTADAIPAGPMVLSESQLDSVVAGGANGGGGGWLARSISSQGSKLGMGTEEDLD